MLSFIKSFANIDIFCRKSTPWGVSVIIIDGMPVAICDKYLDSIGGNYEQARNKESTL